MRVLLLTRYGRRGASSRIRTLQYLPYIRSAGVDVDWHPLLKDRYIQSLYEGGRRPGVSVAASYFQRVWKLLKARQYDLLWVEKELFPWAPAWVEGLFGHAGTPWVVDYDDALFHRYDMHRRPWVRATLGHKIDLVMRDAGLVVAGNRYIAARALRAGARNVQIIPTVVDTRRYGPASKPHSDHFTIGWIGTPRTAHYLKTVEESLLAIYSSGGVRVLLIGLTKSPFHELPARCVEWTAASEPELLKGIDVGIMPLTDGAWERGKCGYKLLQYMASYKPTVASPVGANNDIVEHGQTGFLAHSEADWRSSITWLLNNRDEREEMGRAGRKRVERLYSLRAAQSEVLSLFREVAS